MMSTLMSHNDDEVRTYRVQVCAIGLILMLLETQLILGCLPVDGVIEVQASAALGCHRAVNQ